MNAFADRIDALREKMDEPLPESWKPKDIGDEIVGTFVRLDKGATEFGPSWIAVLETKPGELRSIWLYHSALKNGFARVRPVGGELVGVRYEGQKPVKNPTPGKKSTYHDYTVVVDREQSDAPPAWDLVGGAPPIEDADIPAVQDDDVPF